MSKQVRKLKKQTIISLLVLLVLAGVFLRFAYLPGQLHFAGDEGRDMIIVQRIVSGEELPTLGPPASTGGFLLGPAYYYLMAIPMLFSSHPAAPAFMVAIFGILTILLLFFTGKRMHNEAAGLIAATLYTFSFLGILHDRWSWNPNILPFFVALIIFCLLNIRKQPSGKTAWWQTHKFYVILLGFSLGISLQLHATAWLLLPALAAFLFIFRPQVKNLVSWLLGLAALTITMLPWILHEFTHSFANTYGVIDILQSGERQNFGERLGYVWQVILDTGNNLFFGGLAPIWLVAIFLFSIPAVLIWLLIKSETRPNKVSWFIIILGIVALIFYLLYSGLLWPHYFLLLFPGAFLAVGIVMVGNWWQKKWSRVLIIALIVVMSYSGMYAYINHSWDLQSGDASGSYGVPLQDEQFIVDEIVKREISPIDLQIETRDNFVEAFEYLLSRRDVEVSSESSWRVVIWRRSESSNQDKVMGKSKIERAGNLEFVIVKK